MTPHILIHRLRRAGYTVRRCGSAWRVRGVGGELSVFALGRLAAGVAPYKERMR